MPHAFCSLICHTTGSIPAVAMVTTPPNNCQKLLFLCRYATQTFCAHFPHAPNDSHLNLPHLCNFSLGVFAVAMVTTPQKIPNFVPLVQKLYNYAILQVVCTLFSYASCVLQINLPVNNSFGLGYRPLLW